MGMCTVIALSKKKTNLVAHKIHTISKEFHFGIRNTLLIVSVLQYYSLHLSNPKTAKFERGFFAINALKKWKRYL